MDENRIPEKARLLERLKQGGFKVPEFVYLSARDFREENFTTLEDFLKRHGEDYKVIVRSAHPQEESFRGGTFDSLETYADLAGIKYARSKIITLAKTARRLSILRQQWFNNAPEIDLDEMGIVVMPFIEGDNVMAKMLGDHWEFGYCKRDRAKNLYKEPFITYTPHDRALLELSTRIQKYLGFVCEIEYLIDEEGEIFVVQAKDISNVETLQVIRSIKLEGVRRIRKRRNYRERPLYVMDQQALYMKVIEKCEGLVHGWEDPRPEIEDILEVISSYEKELEDFALKHERFAVLGLSIDVPDDLYQIANHYLYDTPELQKELSKALRNNIYKRDYFLAEADTLITKDKMRVNLGAHEAYGIATVRNPLWSVYWRTKWDDRIVKELKHLGFKTGDTVAIVLDEEERPTLYRL